MSENQTSTFGDFPHISKPLLTALTNSAMVRLMKKIKKINTINIKQYAKQGSLEIIFTQWSAPTVLSDFAISQ